MKRVLTLAAVAALSVGMMGTVAASDDHSERRDVKAKLSGFAEVPSISTTGSGRLRLSVDSAGTTISYQLTYSGLEGGAVTGAYLHLAQPGVSGLIIASLCSSSPCAASPVTGTLNAASITGPAAQGIAPGQFAEVLRAIRAGAVYVNVHTTVYPNGEIRGQLRGGWGS